MKNNLENSFHESLKDFEMDYNPKAWESMSAKLDAVMPVKKSFTKWYLAAGIVLISAVATSLFFIPGKVIKENNLITESTDRSNSVENVNNTDNVTPSISSDKSDKQLTENKIDDNGINQNDNTDGISDTQVVNEIQNVDSDEVVSQNDNLSNEVKNSNSDNSSNNTSSNINTKVTSEEIIIPQISSICVGESISIENVNSIEIIVGGPWFKKVIAPNSTVSVTFEKEGTYVIGPLESDKNGSLTTFSVNALPETNFLIDDAIKYDKGLPTIRLVSEFGQSAKWNYGNVTQNGIEIHPHFFKKGNYPVEITIVGSNGCTNSIEKDVYIEESYNLLAVNSFIPQDADIRRNTFMPFALTQRNNVEFNLIIIDPTDGHTVYQTNDATSGWTGIDQKTGQTVKYEKAYIWKVIISNTVQGEKGEYAGTITPLTK